MKTTKITPTGNKEVEIKLGKFKLTNGLRLSSVSPVGCEYIPVAEELVIEATHDNGESYYVIAFIEYDRKEETCDMRTVGPRFHQEINSNDDWNKVKTLIETAYNLIIAANEKEDY